MFLIMKKKIVKDRKMNNYTTGLKTVKKMLENNYRIPTYQRGYRWDKRQVEDLISDLCEFHDTYYSDNQYDNRDDYYCLQSVIIQEDSDSDRYAVIDGQQRLTTMSILVSYMMQKGYCGMKTMGDIKFDTREQTGEILKELRVSDSSANAQTDTSNQSRDIYHITLAYDTMKKKFENEDGSLNELYNKIASLIDKDKVQLIVQNIPNDKYKEIEIFEGINIGKIRLTDAELIRAKMLVKVKNPDKKNRIAEEWDEIEHALQNNSFWYFIQNEKDNTASRIDYIFEVLAKSMIQIIENNPDSSARFKNVDDNDKMKLKQEIKTLKRNGENTFHSLYRFYEKYNFTGDLSLKNGIFSNEATIDDFWKRVKDYYEVLNKWFHDIEICNYLGVVLYIGGKGNTIYDLYTKYMETDRYAFIELLKSRILGSFDKKHIQNIWPAPAPNQEIAFSEIDDHDQKNYFKTLWYDGRGADIDDNLKRIRYFLLWSNCEMLNQQLQNTEQFMIEKLDMNMFRFPFDMFKIRSADIEHVDSYMNLDEDTEFKNNADAMLDKWKENIKELVDYDLEKDPNNQKAKDLVSLLANNADMKILKEEVENYFGAQSKALPKEDDISKLDNIWVDKKKLGNLCLLDKAVNRPYKNAPFRLKRKDIIEMDKNGVYIYPCTKMVFLKEYDSMKIDLITWNEEDFKAYWKYLQSLFFECFFIDQKETDTKGDNKKYYTDRIYKEVLNRQKKIK